MRATSGKYSSYQRLRIVIEEANDGIMAFVDRMMTLIQIVLALSALAASADAFIAIGVNYGRLGDNLPPPAEVVQLYQKNGITKVRLFDPDAAVLDALRNTNIDLTLGIRNEDLPAMAANIEAVNKWFATYVEPYSQDIVFRFIVVGNEVVPGNLANYVLAVMQNLQSILDTFHLSGISVTTSVPISVLGTSYPPSLSVFSDQSREVMTGILGFLSAQANPLLVNLYPYFAYASDPRNIRLDYAQFNAKDVVVQDGSFGYSNMLDAMIDAFFWAMEKVGVADVDVVVSESGWPSGGNGDLTTVSMAATYNQNFVRRIASQAGTPKRPEAFIEGFVFAMFNENLKPAGVEQHFGLFYPNMRPVYPVFPVSH
ncbi:probable glucan endo-1,3-beta-glucosidase BG4 [Prosopis cineraria]|uniref:probable glucan endo-1,3-beta-glucosidase BG4 n=1 Tax=Prosopis cineraria TaxID=364024 RepID=UPI00240F0D5B|nr:probable glucan endo-1,3-beta-glucosidase BG4 [Prosopis cineraria]